MQQIQSFKREQGLEEGDVETTNGAEFDEEIDLRAEDDALIAAELDAAEAAKQDEPDEDDDTDASEESDEDAKPRRRRGRRGGRRRSGGGGDTGPLEGTFDHGEEGYGLWLDPGVVDNPVYAEHWAGHRPSRSRSKRTRS